MADEFYDATVQTLSTGTVADFFPNQTPEIDPTAKMGRGCRGFYNNFALCYFRVALPFAFDWPRNR
ncbi:MAG: hypothetical protein BroJett018_12700 [Chloroflexota bacterium]|nr:MAG: hypothetical protein BroJett018_12700 [Chloroflexota bacterium]